MKHSSKVAILSMGAVLGTLLAPFIGSPFVFALRRSFPVAGFIGLGTVAIGVLVAFELGALAAVIASVWAAVFCFTYFERRTRNFFANYMLSALFATLILVASPFYSDLLVALTSSEVNSSRVLALFSLKSSEHIVFLVLGLLFSMNLVFLLVGLLLTGLVSDALKLKSYRVASQPRWLKLKLPDFLVWVFVSSLALSFINGVPDSFQLIGQIFLIVTATLYFFQGLVVVETFLRYVRAGFILRSVTYFLSLSYLMLSVVLLGIFDFWFDFRERFNKLTVKKLAGP